AGAALARAGAEQRGVDGDELAVEVNQRAARIAGVDRRVSLADGERVAQAQRPLGGADDAAGHGLAKTERVTDRNDIVADLELAAVAKRQCRQVLRADLQDGK